MLVVITTHGSHTLSVLASTIFFEPCEVGCHLDVPIRAEHSIVSHFFRSVVYLCVNYHIMEMETSQMKAERDTDG